MLPTDKLIKITESPRDAQQGLPYIISPEKRAAFINALMKVGFDVIDAGSFVSSKAIPQMGSQDKVFQLIDKSLGSSSIMAIVGNLRGGIDASLQEKLDIMGFPFSLSETFLRKNINSTISKADKTISELSKVCNDTGKELRVFISMAFGNPYNDRWEINELKDQISRFVDLGIPTITLSDTIGVANSTMITDLFEDLTPLWPDVEFGLHIHTKPNDWLKKIEAAWKSGCTSFDGVINGIGGCPMTGYELLGNLNTSSLLEFIKSNNLSTKINESALNEALRFSNEIYELHELK